MTELMMYYKSLTKEQKDLIWKWLQEAERMESNLTNFFRQIQIVVIEENNKD